MPLFPIDVPPVDQGMSNIVEVRESIGHSGSNPNVIRLAVVGGGSTPEHVLNATPTTIIGFGPIALDVQNTTYKSLSVSTASTIESLQPITDIGEPPEMMSDRTAEMDWLYDHLAELVPEYAGQWVAIDGGQLIAHSFDICQAIDIAASNGHPDPFITAIPSRLDTTFAG
jgi:hypothetical protein